LVSLSGLMRTPVANLLKKGNTGSVVNMPKHSKKVGLFFTTGVSRCTNTFIYVYYHVDILNCFVDIMNCFYTIKDDFTGINIWSDVTFNS